METDTIIEITGLSKTFGTGEGAVTALSDINLSVRRGEIFGIIGLSGAGKSTLVRCINLLERPTAGSVVVDGADMTSLTEAQLRQARRSIGMIFQSFNLLMQRTAEQNICFPLLLAGTPRREAKRRAAELLEIVGLADRADAYPAQLSGGQKQRVAIARMLTKKTPIMVFDDSLSAVDTQTDEKIRTALGRDLAGTTTIIISHRITTLMDCDNVLVLEHGKLLQYGPPQTLLQADGLFRQIYDMQMSIGEEEPA